MISEETIERLGLELVASGPRVFKMNIGRPIGVLIAEGNPKGEQHPILKRITLALHYNGIDHITEHAESFINSISREELIRYIEKEVKYRP